MAAIEPSFRLTLHPQVHCLHSLRHPFCIRHPPSLYWLMGWAPAQKLTFPMAPRPAFLRRRLGQPTSVQFVPKGQTRRRPHIIHALFSSRLHDRFPSPPIFPTARPWQRAEPAAPNRRRPAPAHSSLCIHDVANCLWVASRYSAPSPSCSLETVLYSLDGLRVRGRVEKGPGLQRACTDVRPERAARGQRRTAVRDCRSSRSSSYLPTANELLRCI